MKCVKDIHYNECFMHIQRAEIVLDSDPMLINPYLVVKEEEKDGYLMRAKDEAKIIIQQENYVAIYKFLISKRHPTDTMQAYDLLLDNEEEIALMLKEECETNKNEEMDEAERSVQESKKKLRMDEARFKEIKRKRIKIRPRNNVNDMEIDINKITNLINPTSVSAPSHVTDSAPTAVSGTVQAQVNVATIQEPVKRY